MTPNVWEDIATLRDQVHSGSPTDSEALKRTIGYCHNRGIQAREVAFHLGHLGLINAVTYRLTVERWKARWYLPRTDGVGA